jgi:hypothetical protein
MSVTRSFLSVIVISCLAIVTSAKAALEKAAGKASTSVGLAHTAANAWALETDPVISNGPSEGDPLSDYFFLNGTLANTYQTSLFTLDTDPNGLPSMQNSITGLGGYVVTGFTVDYFANPNGNTDPGGAPDTYSGNGSYPSISVTLTPTENNPLASTLQFNPDADGNEPDINLPVGLVTNIDFYNPEFSDVVSDSADDGGTPNVTVDQFFFQLNLTGPTDGNPLIIDDLNTAFGGPGGIVNIIDPNNDNVVPSTEIDPSEVPEPTGASLLGLSVVGLWRRRRSKVLHGI